MVWLRPGAAEAWRGARLDCAIFDVDGVLIDVSGSFRRSVIAATDYLVRVRNGLAAGSAPLVTDDDIALFKRAGGFNNDWDLTQLLAGLCTARLREWQGMPLAAVPLATWAERAAEAARAGQGGLPWLFATVPATAIPPAEVARDVENEFYWGARLGRDVLRREPLYAPEAPGTVSSETLLLEPTMLPALVARGITRLGIITGRAAYEVAWVLGHLTENCGLEAETSSGCESWADLGYGLSPFGVIAHGEHYAKPDPQALAYAVRALDAHGAIYVGDTADDLHLVLRYRRELVAMDATLPSVLAVSIASGADAAAYRAMGADIVLDHIRLLPAALAALAAG